LYKITYIHISFHSAILFTKEETVNERVRKRNINTNL